MKKRQFFKKAGSVILASALLCGSAAVVLPQVTQTGIEAQAANPERDFYTEENDDGTIKITGYKGASKTVNIPASIFGQKVTKISGYKGGFDSVTSIVIPNSVVEIGDSAFRGCKSLKSVTIPDSVKKLGDSIFYNCTSLTTVRLPNKPDDYGDDMFYGCTSLKTYSIPNGWTCIPESKRTEFACIGDMIYERNPLSGRRIPRGRLYRPSFRSLHRHRSGRLDALASAGPGCRPLPFRAWYPAPHRGA